MTENAETAPGLTGPFQESNAVVADVIVPQPTVKAQQTALFPAPPARTAARPLVLVTRGRTEFLARCPNCRQMHRHVHLGDVTGACGATYQLQPKTKRKGAA